MFQERSFFFPPEVPITEADRVVLPTDSKPREVRKNWWLSRWQYGSDKHQGRLSMKTKNSYDTRQVNKDFKKLKQKSKTGS